MKSRIVSTELLSFGALLIGLALRLTYATHASPYIDEFTTIWAAQRVLATGLPRFPSGAVYTQGLIYTYLEATALAINGAFTPLVSRLPSLVISSLTLALTAWATRRLFHIGPAGLAALWLALDAEAIVWGGRARTYALLQLLVLAAFLAWYRGAVEGDRPGPRWLAVGLLLVALTDQPLVLLILPPLAVLALAAQGWRWLRQPVVWLQTGTLAVGVVGRRFLYQLMIPPGSTPIAEPRAFVDLARPFTGVEHLLAFFTDPNRLMAALLLIGGVVWLLLCRRPEISAWRRPVLCLAFLMISVVIEMLLVVGKTWREPRYLFPFLPLLLLGGEGIAIFALQGLMKRLPPLPSRWLLAGLTTTLALFSAWLAYPKARAAATRTEWGYERAIAVIGANWADGDALATIAPAAAFALLGHADYLAIEKEAQALVLERDGQLVDGWTALPLLNSPERLAKALDTHVRLWFVADEMRLDRHFSPEFLRLLWDRCDLVAFERGVFVFRSRPVEPPPLVDRPLDAWFDTHLQLTGYALSNDQPQPGEVVTVTLRWKPGVPQGQCTTFVHLTDRTGKGVAGHDALPLGGLYPVERWSRSKQSQPFPDRHPLALPATLAPGRYRLEVGLYRPVTLEPVGERVTLDFLTVGGYTQTLPMGKPVARFADETTLYFLNLDGETRPGRTAHLKLAWQAGPAGLDADYTVFLHLLDNKGTIVQQWDAPPVGGWYPTSYWNPGEVVFDDHFLSFSPALPPGTYHLIAGLYQANSTRLPLDNGTDFVEIGTIELKP